MCKALRSPRFDTHDGIQGGRNSLALGERRCRCMANVLRSMASNTCQMNNRELLHDLCLVNRSFNHVFSRRLWRCLEINEQNRDCLLDPQRRGHLLGSENLQLVRILVHRKRETWRRPTNHQECEQCVESVRLLVEKLPGLQTIAYVHTQDSLFQEVRSPTDYV